MDGFLAALQALDARAFLLVNHARHPLLDLVMPVLSAKTALLVPAAVVLIAAARARSRWAWVFIGVALLAVGVSDLAASQLKPLLHRLRPCHALAAVQLLAGCTASFSLPSNHATNMAALAATGWVAARWLGIAVALLALGVGWSRVYLGVHYPADVLAGYALGAALGALLASLAGRLLSRRLVRDSAKNRDARA